MTDSLNHELLRLAREQTDLLSSEFIAPVTPGCNVLVRLGGHWCSMMIVPPSFEGWASSARSRALSPSTVATQRPPSAPPTREE